MNQSTQTVSRWSKALGDFIPVYFEETPALRPLLRHSSVVLHGSTTLGVDDPGSDLDLWVWAPSELVCDAEVQAGTRFFSFVLDGKKGHFNLETWEDATAAVEHCNLERIAELRRCVVMVDENEKARRLVSAADRPMREDVRAGWFRHHYIEMRAYHRNGDNPLDRGDAVAVLQTLVPTLNHAMRAAMVLDRQPYPYIKWLNSAARETPTGRRVMVEVGRIMDLIGQGALHWPGPEANHPLSHALRAIRQKLIESARENGVDGPWLERWWVYMTQARAEIQRVTWSGGEEE